jgi:23S rRNA (guanosine2251-2'-O)-methyltransferase
MEDYLIGRHAVVEALRAGRALHKIFLAEHMAVSGIQELMDLAKQAGVVVQQVDRKKLEQFAPAKNHQGVVAQAAAQAYIELEDLIERALTDPLRKGLILLLDEVEDPHNLGAILRTAECTGVHGVIIPKRRAAGLTSTVAKTSAGAVNYVPVARVSNLSQAIEKLKEVGFWVVGTDGQTKQTVYEVDASLPLVIIVGNEGQGISRLVKSHCDWLVKLPMYGRLNSLNAAVAASVVMYEIVRQRMSMPHG